ncbi:MAG: hypothetical protein E6K81_07195 [Candidatus Eisenbacteria bacterium]|uniref:Uncharacterized protein n=1 Tax=Eiseniibacteriota bacterium TaxID=2212470 RepID=A0A538U9F4_UNCEI|nr:MAG: hypothetical protein E6K81_07195 [Candidatus Eisenbacteria bacterium]
MFLIMRPFMSSELAWPTMTTSIPGTAAARSSLSTLPNWESRTVTVAPFFFISRSTRFAAVLGSSTRSESCEGP